MEAVRYPPVTTYHQLTPQLTPKSNNNRYWALAISLLAFGILWCLGAFIFMHTEARIQKLAYFDCLYFCFVALLTIGSVFQSLPCPQTNSPNLTHTRNSYGDIAPKSNIGKPFFILWSLIAVPIVTFLITEMSKTVITAVTRGTSKLTDWTVLLDKFQTLRNISQRRQERKRIARGFQVQDPDEVVPRSPTDIEMGGAPDTGNHNDLTLLANQLALTIKSVAHDLKSPKPKRYTYDEWQHFTRLIRFGHEGDNTNDSDKTNNHVEWDWIGEDSPMLADVTETEWVLDRLCESLDRYTARLRGAEEGGGV